MPNFPNRRIEPFPASFSTAQQLNYLQTRKDTNYVFLFGRPAAGKTAVTASLIHYLSAFSEYGELDRVGNQAGRRLAEAVRYAIGKGKFPGRSVMGNVTEIDCRFVPNSQKRHLDDLNLSFLEMSGEDLRHVDLHDDDSAGKLPDNIDVYFKKPDLSMTFILVTSYDEAHNDDPFMVNFLDYLYDQSAEFRRSRVLLLVSKWDKHHGSMDIRNFLMSNMRNTYRKIRNGSNAIREFSLGHVIDEVDGQPFIQKYDPEPAEKVFEWLYESLTKKRITTRWERFRNSFDF